MASLEELLAGTYGNQTDYLAQDPWYTSGLAIAKTPLPQAKTNAEAILGPIIQGLISGGLRGYGESEAYDKAYKDMSANPLLKALNADLYSTPEDAAIHNYNSEIRPEGWTPKVGMADLLIGRLAKEQADKDKDLKDRTRVAVLGSLMNQDPNAGIVAAKNLGIDLGELPPIEDTGRELRKRQMDEIQSRFDEKKKMTESQLEFPGYSYDKQKVRPTPSEAAKVRQELENNAVLKESLQALGDNIDKEGFINIFGNNAQLQGALSSFIFNTQRKATNSGARLEGREAQMLQAMTPAVAAGDFGNAIKAALTGREPQQLAKDMINIIDKQESAMMRARYGATKENDPWAPPDTSTSNTGQTVRGPDGKLYLITD